MKNSRLFVFLVVLFLQLTLVLLLTHPVIAACICNWVGAGGGTCSADCDPAFVGQSCTNDPECASCVCENLGAAGMPKYQCSASCVGAGKNCTPGNLTPCASAAVATATPIPGGGIGELQGSCKTGEIDSAIGCIPFNSTVNLVGFLMGWGIGIGGGIAFILIVFAAFQIMTSSGDPKKLMAGQELLTSALAGLIMLIFAGFILKMLGASIFGIPGL